MTLVQSLIIRIMYTPCIRNSPSPRILLCHFVALDEESEQFGGNKSVSFGLSAKSIDKWRVIETFTERSATQKSSRQCVLYTKEGCEVDFSHARL